MRIRADVNVPGEVRTRPRFAWVLAAAIVVTMLVLGACGDDDNDSGGSGASTSGNQVTEIRAGFTPGFGTLPVEIAREKGYFEANGLDIEFTEGLDLPAWTSALGKQFDIVMTTPSIILGAASQGAPLRVISGIQFADKEHPNNELITNDPNIKSAADLAGKTVGVPTLTGSSADALRYVVQKAGVDIDDVKFVVVPFDLQADQLAAGRIDAGVSAIPFYTGAEAKGSRLLGDVTLEAVEDASNGTHHRAPAALFMTTPTYAQDNPKVIEAWRKSLQQGIEFMESNEAQARKILQAWLKLPPEIAQKAPLPAVGVDITVADLEPFAKIGETTGSLKTVPDVDELFGPGA